MKRKVGKVIVTGLSLVAGLMLAGKVQATTDTDAMHRLYNPNSGEHFYTASTHERDSVRNAGWKYENIGWYAPKEGQPVYRMYNPNAEDHHYTTAAAERDQLKTVGWKYEGIAWQSGGTIPVYRLYNPNATAAGAHHYTTEVHERDELKKIGWNDEGTGFYAAARGDTSGGGEEQPTVEPKKVDVDITGAGGEEANVPGSYRLLYSNKANDQANLAGHPTMEFAADVALTGATSDYEVQFVIAGNGDASGQVGVGLHYQAGFDADFAQGRINVTNINFPANAGTSGEQYYSVNTKAPQIANGQSVKLRVKYFESGYMQTFVNEQLVGQYQTKLVPGGGAFILHANTNATVKLRNLQVFRNGEEVTTNGRPPFAQTSYDLVNDVVSGAY
ncbi:hypothetical protein [Enterococcus sp. CSURQ0835]|uniref:hypothetical protein n=1 Tax=Enterococcus sp. CSURQ0835 TaxID=2681394 RepID=UPI00135AF3E9|nr:hypothetical protein [Enterococcus sp. CSURQ0835]